MALGKNPTTETQEKLNKVYNWYLAGMGRNEIVAKIVSDWGISRQQGGEYYNRTVIDIKEATLERSFGVFDQIAAMSWFLYKCNMSIRDYKAALQVLKFIAELYQIYQPESQTNIHININTLRMMDSQVQKLKASYDPQALAETAPDLFRLIEGS